MVSSVTVVLVMVSNSVRLLRFMVTDRGPLVMFTVDASVISRQVKVRQAQVREKSESESVFDVSDS